MSKYKTPLKDGEAVITPAFNMTNAKAIIHAVGPNFAVTPTAFLFRSSAPGYLAGHWTTLRQSLRGNA